uniref:Uncharacterized protein n=1 Tax=Denticeps clupeoides TaxID=299321 RepID=A0AAY4EFL5_9TELE
MALGWGAALWQQGETDRRSFRDFLPRLRAEFDRPETEPVIELCPSTTSSILAVPPEEVPESPEKEPDDPLFCLSLSVCVCVVPCRTTPGSQAEGPGPPRGTTPGSQAEGPGPPRGITPGSQAEGPGPPRGTTPGSHT